MNPFEFELRTHVVCGPGKIAELATILEKDSFKDIAVVIDEAVKNNNEITSALDKCKEKGIAVHVFSNPVAEPDYDFLDEVTNNIRKHHAQCIVGIGGGSTLDLAKGVATLLTNEGPGISYRGFPQLKHKPLPVIAIPTTAGTGSEVTYNAVFTDSKEKRKLGINSKFNYPMHAILDPQLTLSCPPSVTVSSGMDALVHTLESFAAKNATPYSKMFSREAFMLLYDHLIHISEKPNDIMVRSNLLLGAHYAGVALMNSGGGPTGAMSYPLGALFKVPHGIAGAVFLPKIVRFNCEHGYNGYNELFDMINGADKTLSAEKKRLAFAQKIDYVCTILNVPKKLTVFGINRENVNLLIEPIFGKTHAAVEQNPIPMKREDMEKIIDGML